MKWRGWLRVLHRDIGYLLVGLVLAYSISGVAVNHIDDWDPDEKVTVAEVDVGALPSDSLDAMKAHVAAALDLTEAEVKGVRLPGDGTFSVLLRPSGTVTVDVDSGRGSIEERSKRALLYETNVLHLNRMKGVWTWVADAFAVLLAFLAVSGALLLKGPKGLAGRGKWLVLAGLLVPIGFVAYYYAQLGRL